MGGGEPSDMIACRCVGQAEEEMKLLAPNIYDKDVYMKSGPATPLMDPKLYPARVGPPPESESQRFNQPNVFLEKVRAYKTMKWNKTQNLTKNLFLVKIKVSFPL